MINGTLYRFWVEFSNSLAKLCRGGSNYQQNATTIMVISTTVLLYIIVIVVVVVYMLSQVNINNYLQFYYQ